MFSLVQAGGSEVSPVAGASPNGFPKIEGAEIAATTYGRRAGGDFYDSLRVGPERVLFGLLDVAGSGETNRAILTAAQAIFRTFGAEVFSAADVNESEAMTTLCIRLNRGLMEAAAGVHPCPAFIGCYHEKFGTLCYTNAGHTPGLLRDKTGIFELTSTGLPLGLFSHATCDSPTIALEKGAALALVSRGVAEGRSKDKNKDSEDQEFGLERVKERLRGDSSNSASALCGAILNTVGEFTSEPLVPDDMTALVFVRNG